MKKIIVSLATASLIASSAMAADKGIDFTTTGQAVFYYNTAAGNGTNEADLFDKTKTRANVGVQLNFNADLKNDFTFGSQLSYLGNLGMDKNIASGQMQTAGGEDNIAGDIALTKFFVAKKMGNTTFKLGRQELPKSLSPFVFSEGWNVFKNTFDAVLVINKDIPDTTIVGAVVDGGNANGFGSDLSDFDQSNTDAAAGASNLHMITVQNKSIPLTTVTATYYSAADGDAGVAGKSGADIIWGNALVAGKSLPMGLKVGIQGGVLSSDASTAEDTNVFGAMIAAKPMKPLAISLAYTSVDDGSMAASNLVTGNKTPLYTQMVANQGKIKSDADTILVKAIYNMGSYGKVIAGYGMTDDGSDADNDFNEFDLIYKTKVAAVNLLAIYVNQSWDNATAAGQDSKNIVRLVARYNF